LSYTPEQEAKLLAALSVPGAQFRYIARGMTKVEAQALLGLGLPGVYSYTEPSREVEGGVAGAVIGSTDPDGLGVSGLEKQFDKILTGVDGKGIREVDKNGRSIAGVQSTTLAPVAGDDIVLTLDKNIQFQTDTALLDRVGRLSAKGGTAIVMNTTTGQVYAMSNVRRNAAGTAVLASGNFAAVESYEPGSVAKVFSISAALNEGKVTPETVLKVPGSIVVDNFPIRDAWPHGVIPMSVKEIVSESSNIGTLMAAEKIESKTLHDYLSAFGFGRKTGLEYPGESRGILRDADKWRGTEKVTVSYGYGLSSTPLQMIAGVNTVANKGIYVAPQLVGATIDKSGKRHPAPASKTRTVLKPEVAAMMTDMLREVICTGTGELAQVKGMQIAGKTGTGYKIQENGTYSTDTGGRKYFASFVGYFPAANPQVTMLVSIDEPDASSRDRFGGTAAATVFARLVPGIMHELGIQATGAGTGCKAGAKSAGH
jgi:cell division protein FtsI (penicillin-binding protein 3)